MRKGTEGVSDKRITENGAGVLIKPCLMPIFFCIFQTLINFHHLRGQVRVGDFLLPETKNLLPNLDVGFYLQRSFQGSRTNQEQVL